MTSRDKVRLLIFLMAAVASLFAGCAAERIIPTDICPGAASLEESISLLNARAESAVTFRISSARCTWVEKKHGQEKSSEAFNVKFWVEPPSNIYLQGDVAFDARGLILGSNEDEYWLAIKPKEISSYWWGSWSQQGNKPGLKIDPKIMLESLGIIRIENRRKWSLERDGAYDVLSRRNKKKLMQKVYIYNCDSRVAKIEYFDGNGNLVVLAELSEYNRVTENFSIPGSIRIITAGGQGAEDSFSLVIKSPKPYQLSDKQKEVMFNKPSTRGYENIYKIVDDSFIKQ